MFTGVVGEEIGVLDPSIVRKRLSEVIGLTLVY